MQKLSIEVPQDVYDAITEIADREFREVAKQASYLLLTWAREGQEKRQKAGKVPQANGSRREESLHAQSLE